MERAAIGFRAKTGRAIAVVLAGTAREPRFVWRDEVSLIDPAIPDTAEPYHTVMELPWTEATVAVQRLVTAIERVAETMLRQLIDEMHVNYAGVVGSPQRSLDRIGNEHIRAHAAEGILFRRVLEEAATRNRIPCLGFSDKELQCPPIVKDFARVAGPPWRTDERLAASAALLALSA